MNSVKYTTFLLYFTITFGMLFFSSCDKGNNSQDSAETADTLTEKIDVELPAQANTRNMRVVTGPENLILSHLDKLAGKRVGVVANHTALVFDGTHLIDTLVASGVNITTVFAPEHGFRGTADAGEHVESGVDKRTGLPIVSLYGKNRKPTADQVKDLDIIIFDIQDIGSRHYTYIGTMTYVMEACAENGKQMIVLDRPNPNGWYVDGPVLENGNNSFIGMHEIPIAHGMTIGEYANMVNEEGWMKNGVKADVEVIKSSGYNHKMTWAETRLVWTPPSPNIGTEFASYLYPAICWFEPTPVSLGRGTDEAFTILGAPWYNLDQAAARTSNVVNYYGLEAEKYTFTPVSLPGKSKYPKFQDKECQGLMFKNRTDGKNLFLAGIAMFIDLYQQHSALNTDESFFSKSFHRWPGNKTFKEDIMAGKSPEEIYDSWREDVNAFKEIRKQYLLYPDFE